MKPSQWRALEQNLLGTQNLAASTVDKTLRNLRYMERHGFSLCRPSIRAWERFAADRRREGARGTALRHYAKALQRLYRSKKRRRPDIVIPSNGKPSVRLIPDEIVQQLMAYPRELVIPPGSRLDADELQELEDELDSLRFCFAFAFYTGLRAPSEHVPLKLSDFNERTNELRIYAPKTGRTDVIELEPWLADILRAYIAGVRARLDDGTSNELILCPTGRRRGRGWTRENYRMWLWRRGRAAYRGFYVYGARHWCGTRVYMETRDVYAVAQRLRNTVQNAVRYIHVGEMELKRRRGVVQMTPLAAATQT